MTTAIPAPEAAAPEALWKEQRYYLERKIANMRKEIRRLQALEQTMRKQNRQLTGGYRKAPG